jgi:SseB protein N-terminal domain
MHAASQVGQPPLPDLVFVPARPARPRAGGGREVAFEARTLADGTVALPAFSTVARLVAALGHYQPWVCVPLPTVQAAMARDGVPQVVLDPAVDPSAWRWQEASLRAFAGSQVSLDLPAART